VRQCLASFILFVKLVGAALTERTQVPDIGFMPGRSTHPTEGAGDSQRALGWWTVGAQAGLRRLRRTAGGDDHSRHDAQVIAKKGLVNLHIR